MAQSQAIKDKVNRLKDRHERAKSLRQTFDSHWQEIADLVQPARQFTVKWHPGEKRNRKIYDSTAPRASTELAAAVHGLLTNPAIRWFALAPVGSDGASDPNLDDESRAWLYNATTLMLSVFSNPKFGFATNSHEVYIDQVTFGTGVMLIRETPTGIFFQARQLKDFWMMEDDWGNMTDTFTQFEMPAQEAANRWGLEALSEKAQRMVKDGKEGDTQELTIVHAIFERQKVNPIRMDGMNKPWGSVYYEPETCHLISEGGFDENPYLAPRWERSPQETYGRSPAMAMLPTIKTVNMQSKTNLVAGLMATRPPLLTPANSIEGSLVLEPGATIPYKAGLRDKPEPLNTGSRPDTGLAMIEQNRLEIERAFFLDVFNLPDRDRMTATEIIERRQQGLMKASPVMSRQYSEWLTPLVRRVFRFLLRRGAFPPPPMSLMGRQITVDYVSPMALAQRASEVQAFTASIQAAAPLLEARPDLLETTIDSDTSLRMIFAKHNADPRFLFNPQQAEANRRALQEAQQAQAQAEVLKSGASGFESFAKGLDSLRGLPEGTGAA